MRSTTARLLAVGLFAIVVVTAWGQETESAPRQAGDGRMPAGEYVEVDAEGRANRDLSLVAQEVSPKIVHIRGKNGRVAFACCDADAEEYGGFFEWPTIPGLGRPDGKWADLYQIKVAVKDRILRIEGKSAENELLIRARSIADFDAPKSPGSGK